MKNIKIFKLVNGDEIIGILLESVDQNILKIEKPMIFQTSTMLDQKGYPYDLTVLKDWMNRTDEKIAEIPKSQVSVHFSPNENTAKLYSLEVKKIQNESNDEIISTKDALEKMNSSPSFEDILESFMNNVNDLIEEGPPPPLPPQRRKAKRKKRKDQRMNIDDQGLGELIPDELKKRPMIYLSMVIPPESLMNLISAGIIDPEQLLLMIEEVKKKNNFTGDEKKREDFGNKFSDWNPDPESRDYE